MKNIRLSAKFFLILGFIACSSKLHAQKNFISPFPYPPVALDTLSFSHPELGTRVLSLMEEVKKLRQKAMHRYKFDISFEHVEPKPNFWTMSKERLSPEEFDQLIQMAFAPIQLGDSVALCLNFSCNVIGSGPFQIFQYNEKLQRKIHIGNGISDSDAHETYALYGEPKDTVLLGEYRGFISTYGKSSPDTLKGQSLSFIGYFPDSHRVQIGDLPEMGYCIFYQNFLNDMTIIDVALDYVILPISDPLIGDIDEP